MSKLFFDVVIREEKSENNKTFVSMCPSLGIASQGNTIEEALDMIKEAIQLYLEGVKNLEEELEIIKNSLPIFTILEIEMKVAQIDLKLVEQISRSLEDVKAGKIHFK